MLYLHLERSCAFNEMLLLTNRVRDALITRQIKQSFKGMTS